VIVVKERMSQNIAEASTYLPPSENPDVSRSSATSLVANLLISSRCWSRRRFFSRLPLIRALSKTGLTGFVR
jgi:hypothetical protein